MRKSLTMPEKQEGATMKLKKQRISRGGVQLFPKIVAFAIVMCAFAPAVFGDTFTITNVISDWTAPASYKENAVPGAGDTVEIASYATGMVYSADSASCSLVASLAKIKLSGSNLRSCVVFDIGEGAAVTNGCSITGGASGSINLGGIINRGRGEVVVN